MEPMNQIPEWERGNFACRDLRKIPALSFRKARGKSLPCLAETPSEAESLGLNARRYWRGMPGSRNALSAHEGSFASTLNLFQPSGNEQITKRAPIGVNVTIAVRCQQDLPWITSNSNEPRGIGWRHVLPSLSVSVEQIDSENVQNKVSRAPHKDVATVVTPA